MDDGTHLSARAEGGRVEGEDNDVNPFPIPESVKAIPARAHAECTNKKCSMTAVLLVPIIYSLIAPEVPPQAWEKGGSCSLAGWVEKRKKKNLLLWADKAGGGWIHAWVGQCGPPQQCALERATPLQPPHHVGSPLEGTRHGTSPRAAGGQPPSLAGCSGIHGLVLKGTGVIFC